MAVQERYSMQFAPANTTTDFKSTGISGFLAFTTGNISIQDDKGVTLIPAIPVTAGIYLPMPFYVGTNGGRIITSLGASGVLGCS